LPEKSITASLLGDRFGISVSVICAVHCLFVPVMAALLPLTSLSPLLHDWVHPVFILLIAPTVYYAVRRSHFDRKIILVLSSGLLLITFGWLIGHYWLGFWVETTTTLAGSILLISGHWKNYKHHRTCKVASHKHHPVAESQKETN
jgi:hypothetical protein